MIVNKRQLADILGCTEETLSQWGKQGMPILLQRLGREGNQYDSAAVIAWREARALSDQPVTDYDTERTRKVKIEADILGIQKAQIEGRMIPSEKVEAAWVSLVSAFRARMLAIPSRCAPIIAGLGSYVEVENTLTDVIHEALTELSNGQLGDSIAGEFEPSGGSGEAAAEADSIPMGEYEPVPKRRRQRRAGAV
jgi:phage terminase Nu1 subunit (DNA packaging protein)